MLIPNEVKTAIKDNWQYIAAIIVAFVIWKVIIPKVRRRLDIEKEISNIRQGKFNPNPFADGLHGEINSYWGDIEPYQQFNALNDEQIKLVAEAYNRRHGINGATIRVAMQEASYPFSPYVSEERDKAVAKLMALGF